MKFIILTIALIAIVQSAPNCASSSYCMGCDPNGTADKCTSCYNGTATDIGARFFATDACAGKVTALEGCTQYRRGMTSGTIGTTTADPGVDCVKCSDSKFPLITNDANASTPGTATGTLSCATQFQTGGAVDMVDITTGHIASCDRKAATTSQGNDEGVRYCLLCASGKKATSYTACDDDGAITNCSQEYFTGTTQQCYIAAAEYALGAVTGGTPAAFTSDVNCRAAASSNCLECKDAMWFSGSTCTSSAKMMILSFATLLAAWMF